MKTKILSP